MLLFELLYLLQGEEGSTAFPDWLLWVGHAPVLKGLWVATLHMETEVLPVLGHEVAHITGKGFLSCGGYKSKLLFALLS